MAQIPAAIPPIALVDELTGWSSLGASLGRASVTGSSLRAKTSDRPFPEPILWAHQGGRGTPRKIGLMNEQARERGYPESARLAKEVRQQQ